MWEMIKKEEITQSTRIVRPLLHVIIILGLLLVFTPVSFAAEVTNLNAKQESNSIVFDFDVTGDAGETETEVMVVISVDGKELRDHQLHLEGDCGKATVGKGKKITWNVLKDFPNGLGADISWGITAKSRATAETSFTKQKDVDVTFDSVTFPNGAKYVGELRDGRPNGQGTLAFTNGNKYVGEFKDGKQNGQGAYAWANGTKYVGEFKDGKMHGLGTLTAPDGRKYVGEFKDGKVK